ncbi:MAG: N-acetylgalactosamine 6-sulfate sulfatase [Marinilabiliales bacterium]|nr:MAG: N-acetylgalactosamine 6-sulfate sulfatase [Marinilabiliales bacterium]
MIVNKKTTFIPVIPLLTAGAGMFGCSSPEAERPRQPNIVIIITDDQGWGDISLHGNTNLHTPNIDALAQNGAQFTNFYVQPVCSPTRADLLTGRYHTRSGVFDTSEGGERMNLDETTFADIFRSAGYATAAFGKWHNGMQYPYHPNGRGFDEFYGFCSGHWGDYFSPPLEHNGKIVQGDGYVPDDITGRAIEFIRENRESPFLVYIAQITPHTPMQVPDRWYDRFADFEPGMLTDDRYEEDVEFTRAALAMCENIDWNVGRVTDALRELGLEENTIVIFMNDNGPNSWRWNGGMKGRKGSTDEGGVRSPFYLQWKETINPGKVIEEVAGAIDVLPTLAHLAGIEYSTVYPLDGVSLRPLIMDEGVFAGDRYIFAHWNGNVSVRDQRYRLDHQGRLFDIVEDRGQRVDISEEEPEIRERMAEAVNNWKNETMQGLGAGNRPFTVGHPDAIYTQLPARDGRPHGNIVRSNRWPNSSFFTNWTSLDDKITWDVEVLADGWFEVEIHYTCPPQDTGSTFELSFGSSIVRGQITEGHDPPLRGMENDRVKRVESYVKDFKPLHAGKIFLEQGKGQITLQATGMPGSQVMDFRLLMLKRVD